MLRYFWWLKNIERMWQISHSAYDKFWIMRRWKEKWRRYLRKYHHPELPRFLKHWSNVTKKWQLTGYKQSVLSFSIQISLVWHIRLFLIWLQPVFASASPGISPTSDTYTCFLFPEFVLNFLSFLYCHPLHIESFLKSLYFEVSIHLDPHTSMPMSNISVHAASLPPYSRLVTSISVYLCHCFKWFCYISLYRVFVFLCNLPIRVLYQILCFSFLYFSSSSAQNMVGPE